MRIMGVQDDAAVKAHRVMIAGRFQVERLPLAGCQVSFVGCGVVDKAPGWILLVLVPDLQLVTRDVRLAGFGGAEEDAAVGVGRRGSKLDMEHVVGERCVLAQPAIATRVCHDGSILNPPLCLTFGSPSEKRLAVEQ